MRVKHKKTGFIFALKKIPKDMIRSHFMIDQLTLEIKIQSFLNHKNILGVHGIFDDRTHLYIILDYMEQGTLYSQLKKQKILSER
jgi:aurora kinase